MKLGDETVGLRTLQPTGGRDDYGDPQVTRVDVEVRWCSVTPTGRLADTTESEDRSAPSLTGRTLLAPPSELRRLGADLAEESVVIWPITGRDTVDGQLRLTGRLWQVIGEPHTWEEAVEARLRAAS